MKFAVGYDLYLIFEQEEWFCWEMVQIFWNFVRFKLGGVDTEHIIMPKTKYICNRHETFNLV